MGLHTKEMAMALTTIIRCEALRRMVNEDDRSIFIPQPLYKFRAKKLELSVDSVDKKASTRARWMSPHDSSLMFVADGQMDRSLLIRSGHL